MILRILLFIVSLAHWHAQAATPATSVTAHKNSIVYSGDISDAANEAVLELLNAHPKTFTTLAITSPGGEINAGMDLGDMVFSHQLRVNIDDYCLSSCANYVFTAAPHHHISNRAVIGFHGGVTGMEDSFDTVVLSMPESQQAAAKATFANYIQNAIERQHRFFKKVGVDPAITTLGQAPVYDQHEASEAYVGWYYSIDDLHRLGVKHIEVINPPWKQRDLSQTVRFFKVSVPADRYHEGSAALAPKESHLK